MRACKKCGRVKPLSEYYEKRDCADGHVRVCKPCELKRRRERNAAIKIGAALPDTPRQIETCHKPLRGTRWFDEQTERVESLRYQHQQNLKNGTELPLCGN